MAMQFPKGKFISLVKVGEKGQIVIPKGARELFGIQPGDHGRSARAGFAVPAGKGGG